MKKKPITKREPIMACGEFAKPIYDLLDELELQSNGVLDSLIKHLDGRSIESFVEDFRRDHDMLEVEEEEEEDYDPEAIAESMLDTRELDFIVGYTRPHIRTPF